MRGQQFRVAVNGALEPMLDQVIRYNAYYSVSTAGDKLRAVVAGSERLALPLLIAAAGWLTLRPARSSTVSTGFRGVLRYEITAKTPIVMAA